MLNLMMFPSSQKMAQLSSELGYTKTLFLDEDLVYLISTQRKELQRLLLQARQKGLKTVYAAPTEELLRFALEHTSVDVVVGIEKIHPHDSFHYVRGGLDQVLCTIAKEKEKTIAFSFADILYAVNRPQLLARMRFNVHLCQKYKVLTLFTTFAANEFDLRSAADLKAWWRLLSR